MLDTKHCTIFAPSRSVAKPKQIIINLPPNQYVARTFKISLSDLYMGSLGASMGGSVTL